MFTYYVYALFLMVTNVIQRMSASDKNVT